MTSIDELQKQIDQIKDRNQRVEADKAWETSSARKGLILSLTYIVVVLFFFVAEIENPFVNAIVPSLGFFLSTLTVPFVKKRWLEWRYKKV